MTIRSSFHPSVSDPVLRQ